MSKYNIIKYINYLTWLFIVIVIAINVIAPAPLTYLFVSILTKNFELISTGKYLIGIIISIYILLVSTGWKYLYLSIKKAFSIGWKLGHQLPYDITLAIFFSFEWALIASAIPFVFAIIGMIKRNK